VGLAWSPSKGREARNDATHQRLRADRDARVRLCIAKPEKILDRPEKIGNLADVPSSRFSAKAGFLIFRA
jgi:hypothetical protein